MTSPAQPTPPQPISVVPDIPKPKGRFPEWAWWVLFATIAIGATGGFVWYQKTHKAVEAEAPISVGNGELPSDFFAQPPKPEAPPTPPAPASTKPIQTKPAPTPAPAQKITARELFSTQPMPVTPTYQAPDPVETWNAARRGSAQSRVAKSGRGESKWTNTQEDWDEERTDASYPVDLARVITVDRFIPAILVNAINSELGGKVVAQIEENIFGAHGSFVLIPKGSKAIGRYKPLAKPGDERIDVVWSRIITPQGINIHVGNAEMTDAMGRAGITGDVDNRFFDRYGMALLVSTLSAATSYAIPVQNSGQQVVVQAYGSNIANLSSQILDKNINLKPKVSIPAGQRILISPSKDIWFQKPERKEISVVALDSITKATKGARR